MDFPPPSERQARVIWMALTGVAAAALVALAVALVWGLGRIVQMLSPVLWPIAVAGVLAYLLDPVVDLLERKGTRRPRAILLVFGMALLIVTAVFGSIVPQMVNEAREFALNVPDYAGRIQERVDYWVNHPPPLVRKFLKKDSSSGSTQEALTGTSRTEPPALSPGSGNSTLGRSNLPAASSNADKETLQAINDWLANALPKIGTWLFGQMGKVASWFGMLAGLALVPVYTFYFLLEKQGISSQWSDYLPVADSGFKQELVFVLNAINNYLIAFFRGQVLVAMCDGFLYGLGFLLIGLPYAALIGVMAMVLTMIPFLGAIVTCCTAFFIALIQFGDWQHPLLVFLVFGLVQATDGLVISPRIMGGRVGLHPVTIIIAVMAGTTLLGGLLGGILAIPLTAALRVVMFRYVWKRTIAEKPRDAERVPVEA